MTKQERKDLETIHCILDNDDCTCEPEGDGKHPSQHQQYCPDYLAAYLRAILDGTDPADPDDWPDAPPVVQESIS